MVRPQAYPTSSIADAHIFPCSLPTPIGTAALFLGRSAAGVGAAALASLLPGFGASGSPAS